MGPNLAGSANPDRFREKHNIAAPFVLFVGQHYAYKGYRELLEAASIVWKRVPETRFVFIGPAVGSSEDAFRANVDRRIIRLGGVSLDEKTDALSACDILCVPSTQESFGGVYTEAWTFSKPVIGAAIPAVSEVIEDGQDGFLVRQTPAEIADRLLILLSDSALRERLGANGCRKVASQYSWPAIVNRVDDAFRRLL
jgi:glycosyltransferase involved in cell wall biosynthesis